MPTNKHSDITRAFANKDFIKLIQAIPYAQLIGANCIPIGNTFIFTLPKNNNNIGNPTLPAIHGGVLAGFVETAATLHVMMSTDIQRVPKIVNFSIDYLSPGRHKDTYAQCEIMREGRKIVNVSTTVWQSTKEKPIVMGRAQFLLK